MRAKRNGAKPILELEDDMEPDEEEEREAEEGSEAPKGTPPGTRTREKTGGSDEPEASAPARKPRDAPVNSVEDGEGEETPRIRAPLALTPCEKLSDALVFELKTLTRGTKLRITVRAGGTAARATLRFGDM
jgi:hypothetical protein